MSTKRRLLCMSDAYGVFTGFANQMRRISTYLHETGKYDIAYVCWFYAPLNNIKAPFTIYTTAKDHGGCCRRPTCVMKLAPDKTPEYLRMDKGLLIPLSPGKPCLGGGHVEQDKYAYQSLHGIILDWKPDIVLSLGDTWMTYHTQFMDVRKSYRWVEYCPIDGDPMPHVTEMGPMTINWVETLDRADVPVAFTDYGRDSMMKTAELYKTNLSKVAVIPHGCDTENYHPLPKEEKIALKKKLFNLESDIFLMGFFSRNQPRKAIHKMMEALRYGKEQGWWDGTKIKTYLHCLTEGNKIKTFDGLKDVSDIKVGDVVLTKGNQYHPVTAIKSRDYTGSIHSIITAATNIPVQCTAEHRFPIIPTASCSIPWNQTRICYSGCKQQNKRRYPGCRQLYNTYEEKITFAKDIKVGDVMKYPINRQLDSDVLNVGYERISIDNDLMRLFGYYLSDGSATVQGHIRFDFSSKEQEYLYDIQEIMLAKFGLSGIIFQQGGCRRIRFWNKKLAFFLRSFFGVGAANKHIPSQLINQSDTLLNQLAIGLWRGDGCYTDRFKYTTISQNLAYDVWTILIRLGYVSTLYRRKFRQDYGSGFAHKAPYTYDVNISRQSSRTFAQNCMPEAIPNLKNLCQTDTDMWIEGDYLFMKVRKNSYKSLKNKKVYNFSVKEDHTYVVTCCISMNCPIRDVGWNLPDLIRWHKVEDIVILNEKLKVGAGPTDAQMNEFYNACDLTTNPSRGEGWGLGYSESMAAGVPVLLSAYSAHHDWAKKAAARINIQSLDAEPLTNIRRAIVDYKDYATKIKAFVDNISIEEFETKFGKVTDYQEERK